MKSGSVSPPPSLFFFFKIISCILHPWHFHINFSNRRSIAEKRNQFQNVSNKFFSFPSLLTMVHWKELDKSKQQYHRNSYCFTCVFFLIGCLLGYCTFLTGFQNHHKLSYSVCSCLLDVSWSFIICHLANIIVYVWALGFLCIKQG